MADAGRPFAADAFTVRPRLDGGWEVVGPWGGIDTVLPDESAAQRYATSLRRSWGAAPSTAPPLPSARPSVPTGVSVPPSVTPISSPSPVAVPPRPAYTPPAPYIPPRPAPPPPSGPPMPPPPSYAAPGLNAFPAGMRPIPVADIPVPQGPRDPRPSPHPPYMPPSASIVEGLAGRAGQFGSTFSRALPAAVAFGGEMGASRAAMMAMGAAAPEVAIPLALASEGKRALEEAVRAVKAFSQHVTDENRRLAHFSPGIAQNLSLLDLHNYQRVASLARATEPTGVSYLRAQDRLREARYPHEVAQGNASNMLGSAAAGFGTGFSEATKVLPEMFEWLRSTFDPQGDILRQLAEQAGHLTADVLMPGLVLLRAIADKLGIPHIAGPAPIHGQWADLFLNAAGPRPLPPGNGPAFRFNPAARMP
jgi:hypothetical protein